MVPYKRNSHSISNARVHHGSEHPFPILLPPRVLIHNASAYNDDDNDDAVLFEHGAEKSRPNTAAARVVPMKGSNLVIFPFRLETTVDRGFMCR